MPGAFLLKVALPAHAATSRARNGMHDGMMHKSPRDGMNMIYAPFFPFHSLDDFKWMLEAPMRHIFILIMVAFFSFVCATPHPSIGVSRGRCQAL